MKGHISLWLLTLAFFANSAWGADQALKFTTIAGSVNSLIAEKIIREAYQNLNIAIEINPLPAERSIRIANSGEPDGELYRIGGMSSRYPNLIMVPVPVNYLEAAVFTTQPQQQLSSWKELEPLRIGIRRGVKFSERETRRVQIEIADSNAQLFQMLLAKRADVIVIAHLNGLELIKQQKLRKIYKAGVIARYPLYHYLHIRHQQLLADISKSLAAVTSTGEIQRLRLQHIQSRAIPRLTDN